MQINSLNLPLTGCVALTISMAQWSGQAQAQTNPVPPAKTLCVAAVQMRSTRGLTENIARVQKHLRASAQQGARVAVFPECALTGYFEEVITNLTAAAILEARQQVANTCRELGIYAILGSAHREGDRWLDSAYVITPEGRILERYDKLQLAESWPEAGDHLSVFKIDGVPCSITICHDERYPELVRLPVLAGARLVFYLSHESSLRAEHKINPYRAQIQARAVENSVFIVHANASAKEDLTGSHGQSRMILPAGNITEEASIFGEEILVETLDLKKATAENARGSLRRGPLTDWWKTGLNRIRFVE